MRKLVDKFSWRARINLSSLRAFKTIREQEGEVKIFEILNKLTQEPVFRSSRLLSLLLGQDLFKILPQIISQKIFRENLDKGLGTAVMCSRSNKNSVSILSLPKQWRSFLETQGVKTHWLSPFCFVKTIIHKYREGLSILYKLATYKENLINFNKNYIVFVGFPQTAFNTGFNGNRLNNFLTYARERFPNHKLISLGNKEGEIDGEASISLYPFPSVKGVLKLKFIAACIWILIKATMAGILGKWQLIYIYSDWLFYSYFSLVVPKDLPQKIIFSNSHYIYRPLWTIEAERRGVEVSLMFYATNTYNVLLSQGTYGLIPGYLNMTWPCYYTFHENHAQFLRETLNKDVQIHVEQEPIPLEDIDDQLILPSGYKLALFDVQPFQDAYMAYIGRPTPIYTYEISKKYFEDLLEWCEIQNAFFIIKPKRKVGRRLCPKYSKMLKELAQNKLVRIIDSNFSPSRICERVDSVICQPFTSAAVFAKKIDISVAYYDPTFLYAKQQPAAQGIIILQGKEELFHWLSQRKKNNDK